MCVGVGIRPAPVLLRLDMTVPSSTRPHSKGSEEDDVGEALVTADMSTDFLLRILPSPAQHPWGKTVPVCGPLLPPILKSQPSLSLCEITAERCLEHDGHSANIT